MEKEISDIRETFLAELRDVLRRHEYNTLDMLAHVVCGVCDVDVADMLSSVNKQYLSQARWLFWYAYRFVTGETYEKIAERTAFDGRRFTIQSVAVGVTTMGRMVEKEKVWAERWSVVRQAISVMYGKDADAGRKTEDVTIQVIVPHGVKIDVKTTNDKG